MIPVTARSVYKKWLALTDWIRRRKKGAGMSYGDIYYGNIAENYLHRREKQEYWHLEQATIERMLKSVPNGSSVLDVPFGTGRFVQYYSAKDMTIYGLDSSRDMLDVAAHELKERVKNCGLSIGDARALPYGDRIFDLVVCVRFVSHVVTFDQAKEVLREIGRVARSRAFIQFRVGYKKESKVPGNVPVENRLDKLAIAELLAEFGFAVRVVEPLESRDAYFRAVFDCEKV